MTSPTILVTGATGSCGGATLREIVRRGPRTNAQLLAIKGIGPSFVQKHADSLLELLHGA